MHMHLSANPTFLSQTWGWWGDSRFFFFFIVKFLFIGIFTQEVGSRLFENAVRLHITRKSLSDVPLNWKDTQFLFSVKPALTL